MTHGLRKVIDHLFRLSAGAELEKYTDKELLRRFVACRDQLAFGVLINRHRPMVWGVCWRILRHDQDAEDAYQATFAQLFRQAATIQWRESIDGWLHTVARRMAANSKKAQKRRLAHEQQKKETQAEAFKAETASWELAEVLDKELGYIAEKYRSPLILCYLEGLSREEAARRIGVGVRSLEWRLSRGRELLRERLLKRHGDFDASTMLVSLSSGKTLSKAPADLAIKTIKMMRRLIQMNGLSESWATVGAVERIGELFGACAMKTKVLLAASSTIFVLTIGNTLICSALQWHHGPRLQKTNRERVQKKVKRDGAVDRKADVKLLADRYGDSLPTGALGRLGTLRLRISAQFPSLAFTSGGKELIGAGALNPSQAGTAACLWDVASGRPLRRFGDDVRAIALSRDRRILAGKSEAKLCLWDAATGKLIRRLHNVKAGDGYWEEALALSPDGRTSAAAGWNLKTCLWDVVSGKLLWDKEAGKGWFHHLAYSSDGKTLFECDEEDVHVWEVATGKALGRFGKKEIYHITGCDISSPGGLAVISYFKPNQLKPHESVVSLWNIAAGKELWKREDLKAPVTQVAFSPDVKSFATCSFEGCFQLWDARTGLETSQWKSSQGGDAPLALAFSPDGKVLAAKRGHGSDCTVHLWDVGTGRDLTPPFDGHKSCVNSVAFAQDGQEVVSSGKDGVFRVWDATTGVEKRQGGRSDDFRSTQDSIVSRDSKTTAFIESNDDTHRFMRIVRREGGDKELCRFPILDEQVNYAALSRNGETVVYSQGPAESGAKVYLRSALTGKELFTFPGDMTAFSSDGKILAVLEEHFNPQRAAVVCLRDIKRGVKICSVSVGGLLGGLALSPSGNMLAIADAPQNMKDSKAANYKIRLLPLLLSKDGAIQGFGSCCWDIPTTAGISWICNPPLVFSPDGRVLAACDRINCIHVWETASGKRIACFEGQEGGIYSLAFAPDGRRLVSGGDDCTALIWDATGHLERGRLRPAWLSAEGMSARWDDLANGDASIAHQAIWTLISGRGPAVAFLGARLRPASRSDIPAEMVAKWIRDLDANAFAVRKESQKKLQSLGTSIMAHLRQALQDKPSADKRKMLQQLLEILENKRGFLAAGDELRNLRALQVLEQIGTPESRQVLQNLAEGAAENRQTQEAQAALRRWKKDNVENRRQPFEDRRGKTVAPSAP